MAALIPLLGKAWSWIVANIWNIMKVVLVIWGGWSAIQIGGSIVGGVTQTIQSFAPIFTMMMMFMMMFMIFQFFSVLLEAFKVRYVEEE